MKELSVVAPTGIITIENDDDCNKNFATDSVAAAAATSFLGMLLVLLQLLRFHWRLSSASLNRTTTAFLASSCCCCCHCHCNVLDDGGDASGNSGTVPACPAILYSHRHQQSPSVTRNIMKIYFYPSSEFLFTSVHLFANSISSVIRFIKLKTCLSFEKYILFIMKNICSEVFPNSIS